MPIVVIRTAAAALLLSTGCTAHLSQARQPVTGVADLTVTVSAATIATSSLMPGTPTGIGRSSGANAAPGISPSAMPSAVPTGSSPAAITPRTRQIVLRPVTDTGRAAPGYTVVVLSADHQLDCGGSSPYHDRQSPVAVDAGPVACSPSSEYALACWNGPVATTALCYQDPWQRRVVQVHTGGRLPVEPAPEQPSPLGLVLSDGTRCSIRGGGAWANLDGHPDMFGSYGCQGSIAVWARPDTDGIDRFRALWRVRLAPMSGHGQLHVMTVRTAYFVGTARS